MVGREGDAVSGAIIQATPAAPRGEIAMAEAALLGIAPPAEPRALVVRSEQSGAYSLDARRGIWRLEVSSPGHAPRCLDLVPLIEDRRLPTVVLEDDPPMRIEVADAAGNPLEGALVRLAPTDPKENRWGRCNRLMRTGRDGSVTLEASAGGLSSSTVRVFHPGFLEQSVTPRSGSRIILQRSVPLDLAIQVRCEDCPPLSEAGQPTPPPALVAVAGEGRWPLAVGDSRGGLRVSALPTAERVLTILSPDGRAIEVETPLPSGSRQDPLQVSLPNHRSYSGRLLEARADPPKSIEEGVVWSSEDIGIWGVSESDGSFVLRDAPIGSASSEAITAALSASAPLFHREDQFFFLAEKATPEAAGKVAFEGLDFHLESARDFLRQQGWISGPDGEPVNGARVTAVPLGWQLEVYLALSGIDGPTSPFGTQTVESDGDGFFRLGLRGGVYELIVTHPQFAPAVFRGIEVRARSEDLGTFTLSRGFSLGGVVTDQDGNPLAGASIEIDYPAQHRGKSSPVTDQTRDAVRTGSDGTFSLTRLPDLDLDLRVGRPGFTTRTLAVRPPVSEVLSISLEALSKLGGRVVDESLRPVAGAVVALGRSDSRRHQELPAKLEALARAETGADGNFVLEGVPPGRWTLWADAEGFATAELDGLDVVAGESRKGLEVILETGYRLTGSVLSLDGLPVGDAVVEVERQSTRTDATGRFAFSDLLRGGRVEVRAHHTEVGRTREWCEVPRDLGSVEVRLVPGLRLAGRVLKPDGQPAGKGSVTLLDEYEQPVGMVFLSPSGGFEFRGLSPGRYLLTAGAHGETGPDFTLYGRGKSSREVTLQDHSVEDLELVLNRRGVIRGRVVGLTPTELVRVEVEAFSDEMIVPGGFATPEPDGSFEIEALPPGDWVVSASLQGTSRSAAQPVRLTDLEQKPQTLELRFGDGVRISGRVFLDNEPLGGAEVSWLANGGVVATSRTDWRGEFTLEEVPTAVGLLRVVTREGDLRVTADLDRERSGDVSLNIETAALRGTVIRPDGAPLAHAGLALVPEGLRETPIRASGITFLETNARGELDLPSVPLGRYSLDLVGYPGPENRTVVDLPRASDSNDLLVIATEPQSFPRSQIVSLRMEEKSVPKRE